MVYRRCIIEIGRHGDGAEGATLARELLLRIRLWLRSYTVEVIVFLLHAELLYVVFRAESLADDENGIMQAIFVDAAFECGDFPGYFRASEDGGRAGFLWWNTDTEDRFVVGSGAGDFSPFVPKRRCVVI